MKKDLNKLVQERYWFLYRTSKLFLEDTRNALAGFEPTLTATIRRRAGDLPIVHNASLLSS
jgi:hypothetical protein